MDKRWVLITVVLGGCAFTPGGDPPALPGGGADEDAGLAEADAAVVVAVDARPVDAGFDPATCPAGYDLAIGRSRYRISLLQAGWTAAADDCADDRAGATHLWIPDDDTELEALDELLCARAACNWTWLGIHDAPGGWRTVTGQPTFLRWDDEEPDDDDDPVGVATKPVNHRMMDAPRFWSLRYVCECDGRAAE